ncbi:hypothetical protein PpBr36_04625 [Pyricularia pennisetigena]|uniref:hypothetical protein n=1 Tax=Pyricularia pennisetigena TaxID=1578925 RepID=UPI00114F32EA|nr:hypothetical protein PpBr36_04625 [Pyricularia pennisetigena]TLS27305.1 hypothetical protein PpBr36_04625 [Pyricularia pennisetigena]
MWQSSRSTLPWDWISRGSFWYLSSGSPVLTLTVGDHTLKPHLKGGAAALQHDGRDVALCPAKAVFNEKGGKPIEVEDEVLTTCVYVVQDSIYAAQLRGLLDEDDFAR